MLKKGSIAVACLAVATTAYWSWAATSWQLQTKVGTEGGSIQVRNNPPQTTAGSISFTNFTTTSNAVSVVVKSKDGYSIASVTQNGVKQTFSTPTTEFDTSFSKAASAQTLIANFVANQFSVTNSVSDATLGAITPSTTVKSGGSAVITAKPLFQNGVVTGIYINGSTTPLSVPGVTFPSASPVTFTLSNITGNETVVASFAATTVSAGANQFASPGQTVTLNGSAQTVAGSTFAWSIVSAPAGSTAALVADATGLKPTFTPVQEGAYVFQLTESLGGTFMASSTMTLKVSSSFGSTMDYFRSSCNGCHNPNGAMATTAFNDFSSSTHWRNLRNNGDSAVAGDQGATCATNKCHFNSVNAPACFTCHSGDLNADGTFNSQAFDHTTQPQAKGANTCMICHSGSHHGGPTAAYLKSSHYLNPYGEGVVDCQDCHNPHSTQATFPAYADATKGVPATFTAAGSCDSCHAGPYSIFNADGTMKTGHSASKLWTVKNVGSTTKGWYSGTRNVYLNLSSSYVTPNNSCQDCHGHNNQVNAEYAETMHGDTYGRWKGTDYWKFRGFSSANATTITPSNSATDGCVRCHTTTGFVNFVNTGFKDLRAWGFANTADPTSEVITCRACHNTTAGAINGEKTVALPEGPFNDGIAKDYNSSSIRMSKTPFPAYYNYSSKLTGKYINSVKGASSTVAVQFSDFKNSNVCIPCHSGRSGNATNGDVIKALAAFSGFTTLGVTGNSVPGAPHGVYQASVLDAKIGYTFSKYTTAANGHATIGVGGVVATNTVSGPCVTCHMPDVADGGQATSTHKRHSFDIRNSDGSVPVVCSKCHSSSFGTADLDAAKANFQASVSALGELLANPSLNKYGVAIAYYNPAIPDSHGGPSAPGYVLVMPSASRLVSQSLTPAQNAELVGIVYNFNLLWGMAYGTTEIGGYAHNPQFTKQLVFDTIDHLRAASTGSVPNAISLIPAAASGTVASKNSTAGLSAAQAAAATTALNNVNNHYATGAYKVQYMVGTSTCTSCHNPAETATEAAARVAWAESEHGLTTGSAWMPGSSHLWRSSGDTKDFSVYIPASDCQRCHTADGFALFAGSNFKNVTPVDSATNAVANSPLNCNACHVAGNSTSDFPRRTVGPVATFYNVSTGAYNVPKNAPKAPTIKSRIAANFPDVGESNMCNACHSARVAGPNLADLFATGNWNLSNTGFQNSHYMGASGTMYMKAGFKNFTTLTAPTPSSNEGSALVYSSKNYNATLTADSSSTPDGVSNGQTSSHRRLGTSAIIGSEDYLPAGTNAINLNGPCVTCHLKAYNPIAGNGHTPPAAGRPGAGHSLQIDEATAEELCLECHGDAPHLNGGDGQGSAIYQTINNLEDLQSAMLEGQSTAFQNGLNLIKQLLQVKYMIKYDPANYPYFYDLQADPSGTTAVTDWTRKNVAGVSDLAVKALNSANVTVIPAGGLTQAQAYRLMGACFNLNLLARDPGAFVHARTYSQRLVYDTVDYLDDNQMDFTSLTTARALSAAGLPGLAGVYVGTNVNVHAADGTLATESMAWLAGTHYTEIQSGNGPGTPDNTLKALRLRP